METSFDLIGENCELTFARVTFTAAGEESYYLSELSSLQVMRELPIDTSILVTDVFSERQRIFQKIEMIKRSNSVKEFLDIALPLVENGNFPCRNLTITIDNQIKLDSYNDWEIHLTSANKHLLQVLLKKIIARQHFDPKQLDNIIDRPHLYHRLERPDKIVSSYSSYDEVIEAI